MREFESLIIVTLTATIIIINEDRMKIGRWV